MSSRHRSPLVLAVAALAVLGVAVTTLAWTSKVASGSTIESLCARRSARSEQRQLRPSGVGRRVLVIGDSYSLGFGLPDPQPGSWPSRLRGRVFVEGYSGSGFSRTAGQCRGESYAQRAPAALVRDPDVVVVEGGLNDYDQPLDRIEAGYRRLLAELRGFPVLVVGPAPAPARLLGAERVDRILRRETERTRTPYLSMIGGSFSYLPGGVHLTAPSQRAFGDLVAARMQNGPGPESRAVLVKR